MYTLLSAHISFDTATQRRDTFVTNAARSRLARWSRSARHDTDIGSVLPFRAVTTAENDSGHASARVA
jgi:hypothetical protein